ncbi:toll/interleukin-1 receptor domain-containing protein [Ideonella sp.]|jgi:hypothetical protein|uniref:toll/interleukin-1 receptor domain-containing protein n=1 Tax=Ideonella sp. TaxID=1929293 RepID=UPI0037C0DAC9
MPHHVFLSHDSRDHALADVIGRAITRMSLNQVSVWHSSDPTGTGGLKPGHVWLDEIRQRLASSKAVIALLTPTSIARPWLLFESGYGAANPDCDVIPVCVGIDSLSDVPYPLAMYQSYLLSDYNSLRRFAEKLLNKYGIHFDEEMAKPVLDEAVAKLLEVLRVPSRERDMAPQLSIDDAVSEIKEHLDRRLVGFLSSAILNEATPREKHDYYTVSLDLGKGAKNQRQQYIEVGQETSVQDVLDAVYRLLDGEFEAFKYLEKWMLRENGTGLLLVIREVSGRIPASVVLKPSTKWEVVRLKRPYSPTDSSDDIDRWYGAE